MAPLLSSLLSQLSDQGAMFVIILFILFNPNQDHQDQIKRDVMSSMKAETPVIRSPAHNLLLHWIEYLLLQRPMFSQNVTLLSYIRVFPSIWSEKNYVFQLVSFKNTCVYSFLWIAIHWVCRIDTNRSDKISMHRDAPVNRYTPIWNCHLPIIVLIVHVSFCWINLWSLHLKMLSA